MPFAYPPRKELMRIKCRSVCLGSYIKWDTKKQVEIIKRELGWKGQQVEGMPPEYDYEKIECFIQGVRDYFKFIKRGFGRTNHLANIDIRNKRMTREEGWELGRGVRRQAAGEPRSVPRLSPDHRGGVHRASCDKHEVSPQSSRRTS